jgi:integrase
MRRTRYQFGSVQRKPRRLGPDIWVYRYIDSAGKKRSVEIGDVDRYKTKAKALKASEHLRMTANPDKAIQRGVTFGALLDRYEAEEMPSRFSTRKSYKSNIRTHVRPKWAEYRIEEIKSFAVESWLKDLGLEPKTLGNIKTIMSAVISCAMRWEMLPMGVNPMSLVRIKGVSKRSRKPLTLTIEQVYSVVGEIKEIPFMLVDVEMIRTMIWTAVCLGLSASELSGLKWCDVDFGGKVIWIRRGVVSGRVGEVKTIYREAPLPLAPEVSEILAKWRQKSSFRSEDDWLFPNPTTGGVKPINAWNLQTRHLKPAGLRAKVGPIGWHSFRHTYRALLDATGAPLGVQQKLMRHANITTTMNVYGDAYMKQKREANDTVVREILSGRVQ